MYKQLCILLYNIVSLYCVCIVYVVPMVCFNLFQCYRILKILPRKFAVLSLRHFTFLFCVVLVLVVYVAMSTSPTAVVTNGTHPEIVCVPISMRRITGGSATVAPKKEAPGGREKTLLSDIGCRYIVQPVQQANTREQDSLLSNDHILYAKKVRMRLHYSKVLVVL